MQVDNIENTSVEATASVLRQSCLFPERVNVGFVPVIDQHPIRLRVYERGRGETLACGRSACAAAVAGIEQIRLNSPVWGDLTGGKFMIGWPGMQTTSIYDKACCQCI